MEGKAATENDWDTSPMPFLRAHFKIKRHFTDEEIEKLKCGNIPCEMEDKWFFYFENGTLYAHRSWSGICIYIVNFNFSTDVHRVTVNRNRKQYQCRSKKKDKEQLNRLLTFWTAPKYDYRAEWIDETARAVEESKER